MVFHETGEGLAWLEPQVGYMHAEVRSEPGVYRRLSKYADISQPESKVKAQFVLGEMSASKDNFP